MRPRDWTAAGVDCLRELAETATSLSDLRKEARALPVAPEAVQPRAVDRVFDPAGNMLQETVNNVTTMYAHNSGNQLTREISPNTIVDHLYDGRGNETLRTTKVQNVVVAEKSFIYSYTNQLPAVPNNTTGDTWNYINCPTGERASKGKAGESTEEVYFPRFGDGTRRSPARYFDGALENGRYAYGMGVFIADADQASLG